MRQPRWITPLFVLTALVLIPWIVLLVRLLPSEHRAAHWDIAWAGFDVALAALLLAVAVAAWRRSPWLEGAASSAATLLIVDAWFDVLTSSSATELTLALAQATLAELPLAFLCLLLARDTERRLLRLLLERTDPQEPRRLLPDFDDRERPDPSPPTGYTLGAQPH